VALATPCRGGSPRRSDWHGALSLFIVTDEGPLVILSAPRRTHECLARGRRYRAPNARSLLRRTSASRGGGSGVRRQHLVLTVLGAAREQGTPCAVIRAFAEAVRGTAVYTGEIEKLTN
jgi:hypothetical protein